MDTMSRTCPVEMSTQEVWRFNEYLKVYRDPDETWNIDDYMSEAAEHAALVFSQMKEERGLSEMSRSVNGVNNIGRLLPECTDVPQIATFTIHRLTNRQSVLEQQEKERRDQWLRPVGGWGFKKMPLIIKERKITLTKKQRQFIQRLAEEAARVRPTHKVKVQTDITSSPRRLQSTICRRGRSRKTDT